MVSLVQTLTLLFVLFSLLLIILVPILFASDDTANRKGTVSGLATFWGGLLVATAVANSLL